MVLKLLLGQLKLENNMKKIYKNWLVHNMIAHPLSEIVYWLARPFGVKVAENASGYVHDGTIPESEKDRVLGRG
jgi:hypothetical protein